MLAVSDGFIDRPPHERSATSGSSVRHIPCITPELSHFSRSHLWIIFPSLVRDRGIFSLLLLLVPSLFGASSQVALHSAGAECYSSEAWTTPALRPILVLSCPSMRRFACMGNHLDTDALWIAFGYGSSTPPGKWCYLVNACRTYFYQFSLPLFSSQN